MSIEKSLLKDMRKTGYALSSKTIGHLNPNLNKSSVRVALHRLQNKNIIKNKHSKFSVYE